jgi:hypothetical protein
MNLAEIETFLTIVNTKSITRTADLLFLSQPTVSHRLTSLENELGFPLVIRQRPQAGGTDCQGNGFYHPCGTLDVSLEGNYGAAAQSGFPAAYHRLYRQPERSCFRTTV